MSTQLALCATLPQSSAAPRLAAGAADDAEANPDVRPTTRTTAGIAITQRHCLSLIESSVPLRRPAPLLPTVLIPAASGEKTSMPSGLPDEVPFRHRRLKPQGRTVRLGRLGEAADTPQQLS